MLVRALYPFRSTSANELSIHATQRLALIEGGYNSQTGACWGDCGWVRVATLDGLSEMSEGEVRAGWLRGFVVAGAIHRACLFSIHIDF